MPRAPLNTRNPFPPDSILWTIWDGMDWQAYLAALCEMFEEIEP